MKQIFLTTALVLGTTLASPVFAADCYADYKAKKDNPLKLHYGVAQLYEGCSKASAKSEISGRLSGDGWKLLNILSVFDDSQLDGKKANAGQFYLRY